MPTDPTVPPARRRPAVAPLLLATAFVVLVGLTLCNIFASRRTPPTVDAAPLAATSGARPEPAASTGLSAVQLRWLNLTGLAAALLCLAFGLPAGALRLRRDDRWVTICAWTRRIQWRGRWLTVEDFLEQRFRVRSTHGICADEAEKLCRSAGAASPTLVPRPTPAAELARLRRLSRPPTSP